MNRRTAVKMIIVTALGAGTLVGTALGANPTDGTVTTGPAYTITDMGQLPHIADDVAMQINRSGTVAFWSAIGDVSVGAAVWTGGTRHSLPLPAGYLNSMGRAINDRGQVAGWVSTSANAVDSAATVRGVVYTNGKVRLLGTLGGRDSQVTGIDAHGRTVGIADLPGHRRHAFLDDGKKMTDLGALPGGDFSEAFAINTAGDVVGVSDDPKGVKHAVLWHGGKIQDLGILPSGSFSSAQAINDRGQVAGFSDSDDGIHTFLTTGGRMQDLGTLGDEPSTAFSVNLGGDVVGASNVNERIRHAFLWRQGRMTDLNLLLPAASGWSLTEADSINDRGEIACVGSLKGGPPHAVLLTPTAH
jgi:probable HAF family extracellular repeat protein